jgi:hypothetical protein
MKRIYINKSTYIHNFIFFSTKPTEQNSNGTLNIKSDLEKSLQLTAAMNLGLNPSIKTVHYYRIRNDPGIMIM